MGTNVYREIEAIETRGKFKYLLNINAFIWILTKLIINY